MTKNVQLSSESGPECKGIFFLQSYPKSGNTWMRSMLSAYLNGGNLDINRLVGSYGDTDGYCLNAVSPKQIYDLSYIERLMLRPAMLLHMIETALFAPVVVKTHSANVKVEGVDITPHNLTMGAMTIVRDPRDVVISYADHMGHTLDDAIDMMGSEKSSLRDDTCKDVKTYMGSWSQNVQSWIGENPFPVTAITYEAMLNNPAWALTKLLELMGWDVDAERVKIAVDACHFQKMQQQEKQSGFKEKSNKSKVFFKTGKAGGWRKVLTKAQSEKIEADHKEMMDFMGYAQ